MSLTRVSKTIDNLVPKQDQVSGVMVWYGMHRTKMSYVCGNIGPSSVWGFCAVEYSSHDLTEMDHESVFGKSVECVFSNWDDYSEDSALKTVAHLYKKNSWTCGLPSPDQFSRLDAEYSNLVGVDGTPLMGGIPLVVCAGDRNIRRALYSIPSLQILEKYLTKSKLFGIRTPLRIFPFDLPCTMAGDVNESLLAGNVQSLGNYQIALAEAKNQQRILEVLMK